MGNGKIDVYAVIEAFDVRCPARQHALKKLLCAGIRGKGDCIQDLTETVDAVTRAIEMEKARIASSDAPSKASGSRAIKGSQITSFSMD